MRFSISVVVIWIVCIACLCSVACRRSSDLSDDNVRQILSHRNLGLAYLEENRLKEAVDQFSELTRMLPQEALGYANLGLAYLRMGKYSEADAQLQQALQRSDIPDIHLLIAESQELQGKVAIARQHLEQALRQDPRYTRANFKLALLYMRSNLEERWQKADQYFQRVVDADPGSLPARLYLLECQVRQAKLRSAITHLELIRQQIPELPDAGATALQQALVLLQKQNPDEATPRVIALHNVLKPTAYYQAPIIELVGPGAPLIGFPVRRFSQDFETQLASRPAEQTIRFVNATAQTGMRGVFGKVVSAADVDQDNDSDLLVGGDLFEYQRGRFVVTTINADPSTAQFADFNNDGKTDLFLADSAGPRLYRDANGKFITWNSSGIPEKLQVRSAVAADIDHEGDLDLLLATTNGLLVFRNNGDGSFSDIGAASGFDTGPATGAAFADFDNDDDIDIVVATDGRGSLLYSNQRQGRFAVASRSGLPSARSFSSVVAGDYDNDGATDVFLSGNKSMLFRNDGKGSFSEARTFHGNPPPAARQARFFDANNDGHLDLLVVAHNADWRLFLNDGRGGFRNATSILPAFSAVSAATLDYDNDGDIDIAAVDSKKNFALFRNDGGNNNPWLNVRLVGLGPGSGKNNRDGIGSRVEIRAPGMYQLRTATDSLVHFGLGSNPQPDVLRIVWTNGVPQNHVQPQSKQTIVEEQILKGSCVFLYAWNGKAYEFVTDVMWKSALGMPLGIMGGSTQYGFPNSTDEYMRVSGSAVQPNEGEYKLQITEELWETSYLDKLRLVAIDHPASAEIYIDERFAAPPYPPLRFYPVRIKQTPVSATDENGVDLLPALQNKDEQYASFLAPDRYQGITQPHDLILDLGKHKESDKIVLFLNGWIFPSDASINVAVSQSGNPKVLMPSLQVPDKRGAWKTVVPNISFPMGKNKMVIVDLAEKFLSNDFRIRIRTTMQIYWDQIFFTVNEPPADVIRTVMKPLRADLHYRGFSRVFRKTPYSPHWFDYSSVATESKWSDLQGDYTRYGDVLPLLESSDNRYVIMNAGDEMSVGFRVDDAPSIPAGYTRDFLIYCDGWIKDGDMNTAHSQTVEPLPFHGMQSYPYGPNDRYPAGLEAYHQQYNTRTVGD